LKIPLLFLPSTLILFPVQLSSCKNAHYDMLSSHAMFNAFSLLLKYNFQHLLRTL
jgi:hypothetical protein